MRINVRYFAYGSLLAALCLGAIMEWQMSVAASAFCIAVFAALEESKS